MRTYILGCLVVLLSIMAYRAANAYEITTHALITDHAYRISVLNPSNANSISQALGWERLNDEFPFALQENSTRTSYRDDVAIRDPEDTLPPVSGEFRRDRKPQDGRVLNALVYRGLVPGVSGEGIAERIRSWLMRGAIREDDNDIIVPFYGWYSNDDRDDDPHGYLLRASKHFYDPHKNRAFDYAGYCRRYTCVESIEWAIGRRGILSFGADYDHTGRRNHFSWQDARNNYWWAMVLKRDSQGNGYDWSDAIIDADERTTRWASTVKNIGHVIHLLQDAGQPQHVRNDAHGPPVVALYPEGEADAAFEAFTDYRVLGNRAAALAFTLGPGNPLRRMRDDTLPTENNLPAIRLGDSNYYPGEGRRVQFSTPVKFFTTRHIEVGDQPSILNSRRGLADISNRSFFTAGTLPGFKECREVLDGPCEQSLYYTYPLPPNDINEVSYEEILNPSGLRIRGRSVHLAEYLYRITDRVSPNYDAQAGFLSSFGGRVPVVTKSLWYELVAEVEPKFLQGVGYIVSYNNMRYAADVLVPRAVGYSAGMIDFFFRGRLEVTPTDHLVFAAMNQGDRHFVDADGYPRKTGQPTKIFGFESVRLKVRNATPAIIESGTSLNVPQSTGGPGSRLVAIARYHRNACYEPDLSGERVRSRDGSITEPVCTDRRPIRTSYQEISVSAPLSLASGELDVATPIEKRFDFSNDPIPVNATDLFIQVAYRGPLGDERDGIAVGMYDTSEPTFAAAWNNTDYYWTGAAWAPYNTANPRRNVYNYWGCVGSPSKYVYFFGGSQGDIAMSPPPDPGYVRLAFIFSKPISTAQRFAVRAVPTMQDFPHAPFRSGFTRGQIRQASKELIPASVVASPVSGCFLSPPSAPEHWCFDPVEKRRGIVFGEIAQPIYYGLGDGTDVDSVPLPPWSNAIARSGGVNMFDLTGDLLNCPSQPTAPSSEIEDMELFEEIVARGDDH